MQKVLSIALAALLGAFVAAGVYGMLVRNDVRNDAVVAPFYITTMTHMEGDFIDDKNEAVFNKHVEDIRRAMNLFDEYGAKLTIESGESFAMANINWDVNFLKEVVERGHGIGTHADFGYSRDGKNLMTTAEMTAEYKELKSIIDGLAGAKNNVGTSGGIGQPDWVVAAAEAGFKFKDGLVAIAYLSMPESARPEGWTDQYIADTVYHDPIPTEFEERIYPFELKNADDLVPDEDGIITIMGGDLGELDSLGEGRAECFPRCTFSQEDIDAVAKAIVEALKIRDSGRVARINLHIPVKLFEEKNEKLLRAFLEVIKPYVDNGSVKWATQLESYKGYIDGAR